MKSHINIVLMPMICFFSSVKSDQFTVTLIQNSEDDCDDRKQQGRIAAEALYMKKYDGQCDKIDYFEVEARDLLGCGELTMEAFNDCACIEISAVTAEKKEECLNPHYCNEAGKEAAAIIVADYTAPYCTINTFSSKTNLSIEERCRDYAIRSCKGHIPDAYEELLEMSECKGIDPELDWVIYDELEKKCRKTVDRLIERRRLRHESLFLKQA